MTLPHDAVLTSTGDGNVQFTSTVNGASALTINTGGVTEFDAAVGGSTPLASLTTDNQNHPGETTKILTASIDTTGNQSYGDPVTLGTNMTFVSSGGSIDFHNTVDGPFGLTVNSGGSTTFAQTVGGITPLTNVTTSGDGVTIDANMTTSGNQTYQDAVMLGASPQTLTSSAGTMTFDSTVTGPSALTVGAPEIVLHAPVSIGTLIGTSADTTVRVEGTARIDDGVMLVTANGDLHVDPGTYSDAVSINKQITLINSAGTTSPVTAASWSVTAPVTVEGAFSTNGSGAISLDGAVTLGANTKLTSGTGAIDIASTVDGPFGLTVQTGGAMAFDHAVGAKVPLASLTTNGAGIVALDGNVTTSGAQNYDTAVTLGASTQTLSGSGVLFQSTLDGNSNLTITSADNKLFNGVVGGSTPLASLTVNGIGEVTLGANINTSGNLTIDSPALVPAVSITLKTQTPGAILSVGPINGEIADTANLRLVSTGNAAINGDIGANVSLNRLTVNAPGITQFSHTNVELEARDVTFNGATTALPAGTLRGYQSLFVEALVFNLLGNETLDPTGELILGPDTIFNHPAPSVSHVERAGSGIALVAQSAPPPVISPRPSLPEPQDSQELGVDSQDTRDQDFQDRLDGIVIFNDLPTRHDQTNRPITLARLDADRLRLTLQRYYRPVFFHADGSSRTQEIKDELASSIGRFRGNGAKQEVNAAEFARYITAQQSTPQDRAVLQDLRKIQELREQMHKLGITETEAASADASYRPVLRRKNRCWGKVG